MTDQTAADPARKVGGAPHKPKTLVVQVRMTEETYDAYCVAAIRSREKVRTVLRRILTEHAPR